MSIQIRELIEQDSKQVLAIARKLASWFNPLDQMALAIDLLRHKGFVATEGQQMVGFVTYHLPEAEQAELSWFAVLPAKQGQGIGIRLLARLEAALREKGVLVLEVSTVPSDHDPLFAATNAFYRRNGFIVEQRDQDYYAYGRPRILLKKPLRAKVTSPTLPAYPLGVIKTNSQMSTKPIIGSS